MIRISRYLYFSDPRYLQIIVLSGLFIYGNISGLITLPLWQAPVILLSCQIFQYIFSHLVDIKYDFRSPLISSLSLCLLLRINEPWIAITACFIMVSSKFMVRYQTKNGAYKHLFNPANIALVITSLFMDSSWISTGQWGNATWFAFLMAGLAIFVLSRAKTWDISLAFLGVYVIILFARAIWLGDPLTIPLNQLQNGALLLFAFFMISDPKTSPYDKNTRILYGMLVAIIATILQFAFYIPLAMIYSLVICCWIVPLLDNILPNQPYNWLPLNTTR